MTCETMSAMCRSLSHPSVWRQICLHSIHSTQLNSTLLYSTLFYFTLLYSILLYFTLLYSTSLFSSLLYSTLLHSTQVHTDAYWVLLFVVHVISTYFPASNCLYLFISIMSLPIQFTPIQLQSTLPYPFQILVPHPLFPTPP